MENIIEAGSNGELLLKEEVTNWLDNGIGQQDGRNDMMVRVSHIYTFTVVAILRHIHL